MSYQQLKKDKGDDGGNYRQVSLTSTPGKIMGEMTQDAKDTNIKNISQHVFTGNGSDFIP